MQQERFSHPTLWDDPAQFRPPPQLPAARVGKRHGQAVDPVHPLQIGIRYRTRIVAGTAPADRPHDGRVTDAQPVGGIVPFLALGNRPTLPDKNCFSSATVVLNGRLLHWRGRIVLALSARATSCPCWEENPLIPADRSFAATFSRSGSVGESPFTLRALWMGRHRRRT